MRPNHNNMKRHQDAQGEMREDSAPALGADAGACAEELDVVRGMFGAAFAELATLYRNDGMPRIESLRHAGAARDCAHVAKIAHALGGSSISIGASGLALLCKELELCAKAGELGDFGTRLAAIETEYGRISRKLQAMLQADTIDNGMTFKQQG